MSLWPELAVAVAAGVGSHVTFFVHGEHHKEAPLLAVVFPACCTAVLLFLLSRDNILRALSASVTLCGAYAIALFSSILVYRMLFHPLKRFLLEYCAYFANRSYRRAICAQCQALACKALNLFEMQHLKFQHSHSNCTRNSKRF